MVTIVTIAVRVEWSQSALIRSTGAVPVKLVLQGPLVSKPVQLVCTD